MTTESPTLRARAQRADSAASGPSPLPSLPPCGAGEGSRGFRQQLDDLIDVVPGPVGTSAAWARWRSRAHELFTDAVDARTKALRERIDELEARDD